VRLLYQLDEAAGDLSTDAPARARILKLGVRCGRGEVYEALLLVAETYQWASAGLSA